MTGPETSEWRLIREEARDGPSNMALDEVAARTAASGGPRTLRVYRWEPSTLSLGYHQDPKTIDWNYCEREGITVTRRPTGGGAIYHDYVGDISYSIVAPADELPGNLLSCYEMLCEPVLDAFSRMGVPATFAASKRPALYEPACYLRELHPAHDVVVETETGPKKVSGNAQYRQRDAVIQHGSLTFASQPTRHLACFAESNADRDAFEGRVTSIEAVAGIDRETAVSTLEDTLAEWADATAGDWTAEELAAGREVAKRKFESREWTREAIEPRETAVE